MDGGDFGKNRAPRNLDKTGARLTEIFFEKKMTPSQLETAKKLARECTRKKYKG